MTISPRNYSERPKKVVIARNVVTKQSPAETIDSKSQRGIHQARYFEIDHGGL